MYTSHGSMKLFCRHQRDVTVVPHAHRGHQLAYHLATQFAAPARDQHSAKLAFALR